MFSSTAARMSAFNAFSLILSPSSGLLSLRLHSFAGQLAGLLHPCGELGFVKLVVLANVEVARVLALGLAGRERAQRRAAEERHFDVLCKAVKGEEPAALIL